MLTSSTSLKPTLLLHFDINKSIIISDHGIGINMHSMVNSILSECIWGKITENINNFGHYWEIVSTVPSHLPPDNFDKSIIDNGYVTFGDYLEKHVPSNIAYINSKGKSKNDTFTISRDKKKMYKETFTDIGCIGESCRSSYDYLFEYLRMETTIDTNNIRHHHIIPSFFHMMIELNKRTDINYKIIFRTFGRDISTVASELNEFCCGEHIINKEEHPKMDGTTKGCQDRRLLLPYYMGHIKRFNTTKNGLHFSYVCPENKTVSVATGADEMQSVIDGWLWDNNVSTIAIRDDYHWWAEKGERDDSGKLMIVDSNSLPSRTEFNIDTNSYSKRKYHNTANSLLKSKRKKEFLNVNDNSDEDSDVSNIENYQTSEELLNKKNLPKIIQIFFDDNIERYYAHIVDVRDKTSFKPIPFTISNKLLLRRVEPYLAITQESYFINEINEVLKLYSI